jgi:hypothetical protein
MRKWFAKHKIFGSALGVFLYTSALDIISTALVMAYVPGSIEVNVLARDPLTLKAQIGVLWGIKGLYLVVAGLPLGIAGALTESEFGEICGSFSLAWAAYTAGAAAFGNFALLWRG